MITSAEAERIILAAATTFTRTQILPLGESVGRILAEDLYADRDMPPFDRVAMDGIAVAKSDLKDQVTSFKVTGIQAAGEIAKTLYAPGTCLEVMTGASLPKGASHVIPYEEVVRDEDCFRIKVEPSTELPTNVHEQGADMLRGDLTVSKGTVIRPLTVGAAATIGKTHLKVLDPIRVHMIATGDELVAIEEHPEPQQIRRSNDAAIGAMLSQWPGVSFSSSHVQDSMEALQSEIKRCLLDSDVLLISGGVSKGKFDYVPEALCSIGVEELFHRVKQRPGKPLWFGRHKGNGKVVFGLPGNPMSSLINARRFVVPYLEKKLGIRSSIRTYEAAESAPFSKSMTLYKAVRYLPDSKRIQPLASNGSGDFASLVSSDGFVESQVDGLAKGRSYRYFPWGPNA